MKQFRPFRFRGHGGQGGFGFFAAQLFAENGVHATSLADISIAAQVSKGTLYYHYATKEKLVYDVCEKHMEHMTDMVYAWLSTVREDSELKDVLSELLDILTDDAFHVKLHIALCSETALHGERLRGLIQEKYSQMGLLIDLASIRMDIRMHEKPYLKQMFFMALDGFMLHSLMGVSRVDQRQLLEKICS